MSTKDAIRDDYFQAARSVIETFESAERACRLLFDAQIAVAGDEHERQAARKRLDEGLTEAHRYYHDAIGEAQSVRDASIKALRKPRKKPGGKQPQKRSKR